MTSPPATFRPFSNGSEYMYWRDNNCDRCIKRYDEDAREYRCDLEQQLGLGAIGDGTIKMWAADRIGKQTEPYAALLPDCQERVR